MSFNSDKNKALLWDVMLEAGFFSLRENADYNQVRETLDGFVDGLDTSDMTFTDANKTTIKHMYHYLTAQSGDTVTPQDGARAAPAKGGGLQRSSTI